MSAKLRLFAVGLTLLFVAGSSLHARAATPDPWTPARRIDELLVNESFGSSTASAAPTAPVDDATFLRRVWLDLVGTPPNPEQLIAFSLDPSPTKRAAVVDRLLADERFGQNWARYWRDVILYRRTEERALLVSTALEKFLADAFNRDPYWDKIARQFITATGDIREQGATAIIMAQNGGVEDTAAEVSRIFLGIQIQCAQCHDHKTDRWKREQFHQLAAFFPRISVRPVQGEPRSFNVVSVDRVRRNAPDNPRRGSLEHRMSDLAHPEKEGKLMRPVFFVTGQKLETGVSDQQRRGAIANWITAKEDRWFSRAFVNRIWAELVGHGFYEPVDDLGPDRKPAAPQTLDYLADAFVAKRHDVKWLFRTIMATDAYARQDRSRSAATAPFAANCPQRLRGDQLFDSLVTVLGISDGPPQLAAGPRALQQGPRGRLNGTFGFDPSESRDELASSIPQALFLMNAPELNRAINGRRAGTLLYDLLAKEPKDEALVQELYLRALAREPKPEELAICLEHVKSTRERTAAIEDILWSLVNSTEFLYRK